MSKASQWVNKVGGPQSNRQHEGFKPGYRFPFAERALVKRNAIRAMFDAQGILDQKLISANLPPVNKFSIGQPHLPPSFYDQSLKPMNAIAARRGYSSEIGEREIRTDAAAYVVGHFPQLKEITDYSNIVITAGASCGLTLAIKCLINTGDKILLFVPYFAAYGGHIDQNVDGATILKLPTHTTGYKPDSEALRKMLGEHQPKAIIFNNICNPTGVALTATEMSAFADVLRAFPDTWIISDLTYADLATDPNLGISYNDTTSLWEADTSGMPELLTVAPDLARRTMCVFSNSKGLTGDPGARCGFMWAPRFATYVDGSDVVDPRTNEKCDIPKMLSTLQLHMITSVSKREQASLWRTLQAELGLGSESENKQQALERSNRLKAYWDLSQIMSEEIPKAGFRQLSKPAGGFFTFIELSDLQGKVMPQSVRSFNGLVIEDLHAELDKKIIETDVDACNFLLFVANVSVVAGSGFGMDPLAMTARVAFATETDKALQFSEQVNYARNLLLKVNIGVNHHECAMSQ
ncbi:MAG: pyridoxal phosphate-dependent aminotransferase [Alphaproteobacteria bacterium]|nr:pyridoxal phosphate-dependent aminotransferase [Alphaproteobacteria bacterium]